MEESGGPPDAAAGAKVGPKASAARRLVGGVALEPTDEETRSKLWT